MMHLFRAYLSPSYWRHGFSVARMLTSLLSAVGALWLLVEVVAFFSPAARQQVEDAWIGFLVAGVLLALWRNRPLHEVTCQLAGRDTRIRLVISDIFKQSGALVVGTNTTFDTELEAGLISSKSVQGQFTTRYYDSVGHLDTDLDSALATYGSESVSREKPGKSKLFPVGTVAPISPHGRTAYFVAISHLNQYGNAVGSFEDLKTALPALWEFVMSSGTIESLVVPVLGSGFSRLPQTREELVREIVDSFVAACAARRFTDCLTIVIYPQDYYNNAVDLPALGAYLAHVCRYTEYRPSSGPAAGTAAV